MDIDITGLPPERIVFAPSPLAELGMTLHALAEPAHHPGLHGWVTATGSALAPDLADRLCEADFLWRTTFSDLMMPYAGLSDWSAQPCATLAEELDLLDRLNDEAFVKAALEFTCSAYARDVSPLTDPGTRAWALEMAAARGPRQMAFTKRLLADPPHVRTWLRQLFEDCDEAFFAAVWQRTRVGLAADARHKTELLRRKGPAEALTAISPAVTLEQHENSTRIRVDKMSTGRTTALDPATGPGLTCVPTSFGWPHLMVLHAPGWRPVVHYPVAGPELPRPASVDLLKQRLEALSHPLRMRLCRQLARTPHTTGELADACNVSAPEVSRHVAVLKKAGLITTRRRGRYVLHQLDLTTVARLGSDFLETVLR
ncbi:DUF5937 family protein [Streptomyces mashuensis]|uniref:DUF5937 family protein n=1 Tax=Streptomyces mashuensis TaxID=33904 RepID=UPI00167D247B|nr:DUF5937 family protein [Streptomyces mashuensis]